jgi:hypothetical protein
VAGSTWSPAPRDARGSRPSPRALGNFDTGAHKSQHDDRFFITEATIQAAGPGGTPHQRPDGESINAARVLVNEPGNYHPPVADRLRRWRRCRA